MINVLPYISWCCADVLIVKRDNVTKTELARDSTPCNDRLWGYLQLLNKKNYSVMHIIYIFFFPKWELRVDLDLHVFLNCFRHGKANG